MNQRIFGITGWKNSGKTTLTERLVAELSARGHIISTVKHAHHAFDIDQPGTDSFRHRAAGASEVAIVSGVRWAVMHELRNADEPDLQTILSRLSPCDLVLVEGYKREVHKKIETRRVDATSREPLAPNDPNIVAVASDHPVAAGNLPVFRLEDISSIADFIELTSGLREG
jgi:molybdopterin-guanine dinucleotide biosynthesis protein B